LSAGTGVAGRFDVDEDVGDLGPAGAEGVLDRVSDLVGVADGQQGVDFEM